MKRLMWLLLSLSFVFSARSWAQCPTNTTAEVATVSALTSGVKTAGSVVCVDRGTYRLDNLSGGSGPLTPANGVTIVGKDHCDPIGTPGSCTAIITGGRALAPVL